MGIFSVSNYRHIPCSCVCVFQLYKTIFIDIFNLINQYYHVGLGSTFAQSHVNPLM